MNALFVALLTVGTIVSCLMLGVFSAYGAVAGILAIFNPSRPARGLPALVPHQSHVSGD